MVKGECIGSGSASGWGQCRGAGCRVIAGERTLTISPDLACIFNTHLRHGTACSGVPSRPLARAVGGHRCVRRVSARMLLALHAATRGLALCVCLVFFVLCVCALGSALTHIKAASLVSLIVTPHRPRAPLLATLRCPVQQS